MGDKKEELKKALETQFKDVSDGTDGQKKKESVETLKVLYDLALTQDKADLDAEYRESEMVLKEKEMALKEAEQKARLERERQELLIKQNELELKEFQTDIEVETKNREFEIKERELAIRKSELLMKKIEVAAGIGVPVGGAILYQKNFDRVYKFETETIQTVVAPKAAQYMRLMEKTLVNGVKSVFRR